jgi:hypothetical protein
MQYVYCVALKHLTLIEYHPRHVELEHLGYFMSLENIQKYAKSFNPKDWYNGETFEKSPVLYEELPEEDRKKLEDVLKNLTSQSSSQKDLIQKCYACGWLGNEFGNKILERKKVSTP